MFLRLLIIGFLGITSLLSARANYSYILTLSPDLHRLNIQINIPNTLPRVFTSGSVDGKYFIENVRLSSRSGDKRLQTYNGKIYPGDVLLPATLSYDVDLTVPSENIDDYGSAVVLEPGMFFWRPGHLNDADSVVVQLKLPDGMKASVPWKPLGRNRYLYQATPADWPGKSAFGFLDVDSVRVAGSRLYIANPNPDIPVDMNKMKRWLKQAATSVADIYGAYPVKNIQILLSPRRRAREAVPFAQVIRNGGVCIQFFIDPRRPLKEFVNDWTATHELSHALLPFVDRNQAWLSEGMATYYQYVLMIRDGRLSPQKGWERILSGFKRGQSGANSQSLEKTTAEMYGSHSFRNVYWSGAAMMLRADLRLRQLSHNSYSLDDVLARVLPLLSGGQREWGGLELMQEFDRISRTSVFMDIYNRYVPGGRFPVDAALLSKLGIIETGGKVNFNDSAQDAAIRRSIVSPRDARRPRATKPR